MNARHFTCTQGTSNKFWDVIVNGVDVTTVWGRIGSEGQSQTKVYGSPEDANKVVQKTIASKLAKGYVEVGS